MEKKSIMSIFPDTVKFFFFCELTVHIIMVFHINGILNELFLP